MKQACRCGSTEMSKGFQHATSWRTAISWHFLDLSMYTLEGIMTTLASRSMALQDGGLSVWQRGVPQEENHFDSATAFLYTSGVQITPQPVHSIDAAS